MGKEVRITDHDVNGRATDWITGLPNLDDLPPLSKLLISPELASAFNISPEPHRNMTDVTRASHNTLSTLINVDLTPEGSDSRKLRRVDSGDGGGDGGGGVEDGDSASGGNDFSARISKRIRLVWTPQLHKRFVEVVRHLGVKNAVPKTIMQLMNVEGLTRENVASHLQKYRLYLKRMPESDHPFGSTPVPKRLHDSVGYQNPPPHLAGGYHSHPYNNMMMQPKDWSGNGFGSVSPYQHCITPNDK